MKDLLKYRYCESCGSHSNKSHTGWHEQSLESDDFTFAGSELYGLVMCRDCGGLKSRIKVIPIGCLSVGAEC